MKTKMQPDLIVRSLKNGILVAPLPPPGSVMDVDETYVFNDWEALTVHLYGRLVDTPGTLKATAQQHLKEKPPDA